MLSKELCPIHWEKPSREILAQIRGLNPWPVATAELDGTAFKIYEARRWPEPCDKAPGTPVALNKKGLVVACGDGAVLITRLQAQGGKILNAPDYFRGHPIRL